MTEDTEEPEGGSEWDNRNTPKGKRGRPKDPLVKLRRDMRRELDELAVHEAPTVFKKLVALMNSGDMGAINALLLRAWPVRRGAEIEFNLPNLKSAADIGPAMDAVLEQVSQGKLTIEEGERVMNMFSARIKAFEASEVMEEVRKLQEAIQAQMAHTAADRARQSQEARKAAKVPGAEGKAWPGIQPGRA